MRESAGLPVRDLSPEGEAPQHFDEVRTDVASDPLATVMFGSTREFSFVLSLDDNKGNSAGGYVLVCEAGAFHFLPTESVSRSSRASRVEAMRQGAANCLRDERQIRKERSFWRVRYVYLWLAASVGLAVGYLIGLRQAV